LPSLRTLLLRRGLVTVDNQAIAFSLALAAMAETASAYWVSFAKTGDPNGGNRPQWPRHDPAVDKLIDFTNNGVVVGPDPLKARLDLWRKVWSQDQ
jgi:carboxylesterase type B